MTNTISGVKEKLLQKALLMLHNLLLFFMFLFVKDSVLEYESSSITDRYIIKKEIDIVNINISLQILTYLRLTY